MTFGLACDRDGYDLRLPQCPQCGSRGCPKLHRYNGKCPKDKGTTPQSPEEAESPPVKHDVGETR
jgi:hypothetical protein